MELHDILSRYYGGYDEDGRLLSRHGQVEYLTTMEYIHKYLKPGDRVLEVGAGTGRYSLALAGQGCAVDAVELVEHNIQVMRTKFTPDCRVNVRQGNAMDLSCYEDDTFDMTLVLGPMYHLFNMEDKRRAIAEAIRVTKPGGMLFCAYCMNDATIIGWGFQQGNILQGIQDGIIDIGTFKCLSNPSLIFELYRKEDIDALMEGFPVRRRHFVATDGMTNHMRDTIDAMDDEMFACYMRYHLCVCQRPDMAGMTHHSLDIFSKLPG